MQLEDKDHNVLRTEFLDYNTRDSVAIFFNGGSMKDAEGQVIESRTGTYDSKTKTFTFSDNVNMFTDSVFVKTTNLVYDSARNTANFGFGTDAWSEDNMLSSNAGWYDRNREIFLFRRDVHGMSDTQEGWADSLFYYRPTGDIELLGNAQVTDTTRDMSAVAGRMLYTDSLSRLVMTREPAVIGVVKSETAPPDSVYFGADSIVAQSLMMFQIEDARPYSERINGRDLIVLRDCAAALPRIVELLKPFKSALLRSISELDTLEEIREPRFSPVRSDSVSSSERRVAQSSSMYLPPVNRSMRRMCAMSVFCVSLIYRKSAPAADTAAGASPSPASSIEERPNCSHTRAAQAIYS